MRPSKLRRHSALGLSDGDPPVITSINQSLGDTLGGQTVVITGKKFSLPSPGVRFGTTPATSFVVNSDTQITAVAPAHSAGSGDISVSTQGGTSSPAAYEFPHLSLRQVNTHWPQELVRGPKELVLTLRETCILRPTPRLAHHSLYTQTWILWTTRQTSGIRSLACQRQLVLRWPSVLTLLLFLVRSVHLSVTSTLGALFT